MSGTRKVTDSQDSAQLRLYIAGSTPNSVRAEQTLDAVLAALGAKGLKLSPDIIDVFTNGKRAVVDGVIVTPTLVVVHGSQRFTIVGDLSDGAQVRSLLESLSTSMGACEPRDDPVGGTATISP
jgi:circadian clock protein KaiB